MANSMKIIKAGQLPGKKIMHGACNNCGCEFEVERFECGVESDRNETLYCHDCPTEGCGERVYVHPKKYRSGM
jgi:hypothetical protein